MIAAAALYSVLWRQQMLSGTQGVASCCLARPSGRKVQQVWLTARVQLLQGGEVCSRHGCSNGCRLLSCMYLQKLKAPGNDRVQVAGGVCILLCKALHLQIVELRLPILPLFPVLDLQGGMLGAEG